MLPLAGARLQGTRLPEPVRANSGQGTRLSSARRSHFTQARQSSATSPQVQWQRLHWLAIGRGHSGIGTRAGRSHLAIRAASARSAVHRRNECYPVRLRGIYVVNNPPVFQLLYALVKLVLKPKLQRRIHIIGRDYQKLHKLIPRERLPEEYDGTLEKYDYDDLERKLLSQENFFVELGSYGYQ
ncbi:alpha-tocopherol transfer protein-like [Ixodes scapularis]